MCRLTHDGSPSQALPPKRSSLTSSSRSSSSSSIQKRVSFDEKIKIYQVERPKNELARDAWFTPADYRRFRSDSCLELLDQQQVTLNGALLAFFQNLFSAMGRSKRLVQEQTPEQSVDYPWMTPYHPHEESTESPPLPPLLPPRHQAFGERARDTSREQRIIEELAFLP